jgi:hypothetical protein
LSSTSLAWNDFEVAEATYRAAVARWPAAWITLRQGARVIEDKRTYAPQQKGPLFDHLVGAQQKFPANR